jgi:glycosyltransferase involved in cell wall biosynthesis
MKIAIVTPTWPELKTGGIGQVAYMQAQGLAARGHEVVVYTPNVRSSELGVRSKLTTHNSQLTTHFLQPFIRFGNAAFLPQLFFILRKEKFDIVHLHYPFFGAAEIVALWTRNTKSPPTAGPRQRRWHITKNTKLVITYHHDVVGEGLLKGFFAWHTRRIMPWIMKSADKILVSSLDYADHSNLQTIPALPRTLGETGASYKLQAKLVELPFGVDLQKFHPDESESSLQRKVQRGRAGMVPPKAESEAVVISGVSHAGTDEASFHAVNSSVILFVGGLDRAHYFKGVDVLLRAIANIKYQISNIKCLIVGDGDLRQSYEQLADKLGIGNNVIFAGRVQVSELPAFYRASDLVVLPSIDKTEAFGLVLLEAQASGRPVIASNLPGVRTLVEEGLTGYLVEPGNVEDLAKKISKLLGDAQALKRFSVAARKRAEEKYDKDKIIVRLEQVYLSNK